MSRVLGVLLLQILVAAQANQSLFAVEERAVIETNGHGILDEFLAITTGGGRSQKTRAVQFGDRAVVQNERFSRIVDLSEGKVYFLNLATREYTVNSVQDVRDSFEKSRKQLESGNYNIPALPLPSQSVFGADPLGDRPFRPTRKVKAFDSIVDAKETGNHRRVAGNDAREVVLTLTQWEKGQPVDTAEGWVLVEKLWLAKSQPIQDAANAFQDRFCALFLGQSCFRLELDVANALLGVIPEFSAAETLLMDAKRELKGTIVASTRTLNFVMSSQDLQKETKRRADAQKNSGVRVLGGTPSREVTVLSITQEAESVETPASDAELRLPSDYRLHKR